MEVDQTKKELTVDERAEQLSVMMGDQNSSDYGWLLIDIELLKLLYEKKDPREFEYGHGGMTPRLPSPAQKLALDSYNKLIGECQLSLAKMELKAVKGQLDKLTFEKCQILLRAVSAVPKNDIIATAKKLDGLNPQTPPIEKPNN